MNILTPFYKGRRSRMSHFCCEFYIAPLQRNELEQDSVYIVMTKKGSNDGV